jgi:hypothetical protein
MIPESARHERLEWVGIGEIKEGDKIVEVKFQSVACVHSFDSARTEQITAERIIVICQRRCACGNTTGLRHEMLGKLLPSFLQNPNAQTRALVENALKGSNVELRFQVTRLEWPQP